MAKSLTSVTRFAAVGSLMAACCLLGACSDDGMVIAEQIPPEPMADQPVMSLPDQFAVETAAVRTLLQDNCGVCHGQSATRPPHSYGSGDPRDGNDPIQDIGDLQELIASGLITPGMPEDSPLWRLMVSGQMPPTTSGLPPVSTAELRRLEKFIVRLDPPTPAEFLGIVQRNCSSCHYRGSGPAVLPINDIQNVDVLVAAGLIVPGDRDRSPLYIRVLEFEMPPLSSGLTPVSRRETARLGGYIDMLR